MPQGHMAYSPDMELPLCGAGHWLRAAMVLMLPLWRVPNSAVRLRVARGLERSRLCATEATGRLWSPSDLTLYAESPWAAWLERLARDAPAHPLASASDAPDVFLEMLGRKGGESERAVLRASVQQAENRLVDLSGVRGSTAERVAATARAIAEAPAVIYQAPLSGGGFYGVADFLVRLPPSSAADNTAASDGAAGARYMVWDAKLGRRARSSQLLQLCCYSEMLAALQGGEAEWAGLVLGGSQPLALHLSSYTALYRRIKARFLDAQRSFDATSMPEVPGPGGSSGRWSELAAKELLGRDDLRLVAGLGTRQATRLRAAGIDTATALAECVGAPAVSGVSPPVVR
eukprot:1751661-Prymnesium_polylepis.1